jgi:hypothetical protein
MRAMPYHDAAAFFETMKAEFPKMFDGRSLISFGVPEGWIPLVSLLFEYIQFHCDNSDCPQVVVKQVKEKFGGLRVYVSGGDAFIQGMITMAEGVSELTCLFCGHPGVHRPGLWIHTACDRCEEEYRRKSPED